MPGRNGASRYHEVKSGSSSKVYTVTINYDTGHWCECRGMVGKKSKYGEDAGRTEGTCCTHIKKTIKQEYGGDWGVRNQDGSRTSQKAVTSPIPAPSEPVGRREAIAHTRAKVAAREAAAGADPSTSGGSLQERIAALEDAR